LLLRGAAGFDGLGSRVLVILAKLFVIDLVLSVLIVPRLHVFALIAVLSLSLPSVPLRVPPDGNFSGIDLHYNFPVFFRFLSFGFIIPLFFLFVVDIVFGLLLWVVRRGSSLEVVNYQVGLLGLLGVVGDVELVLVDELVNGAMAIFKMLLELFFLVVFWGFRSPL
jgi:hypothetical protein